MENFDDIRPYQDNEVPDVIKSLLEDEQFSKAIVDKRLPKLFKKLPTLALLLVKKTLKKKIKKITKVTEVQEIASDYLKKVIKTSVDGLTVSGLQQLKENSYLFMSNHRDIAMDPAFISYLLMEDSKRKLEIAIGDNLLKKEFVSKLMRLNRSFIVKRSAQGREKLLASNKLSEYIHHRLKSGINIWIAQREGRAKDGIDKTDPTILKMLHMSKRKGDDALTIGDAVRRLKIVPVSISYEFDPCDALKAQELFIKENDGEFEKDDNSDIISIAKGLNGYKGKVHIAFGNIVEPESDDPILIAEQIDKQIHQNYHLNPSNFLAYDLLQQQDPSIGPSLESITMNIPISKEKRSEFELRYHTMKEELKPYFIQMYANPVLNKIK